MGTLESQSKGAGVQLERKKWPVCHVHKALLSIFTAGKGGEGSSSNWQVQETSVICLGLSVKLFKNQQKRRLLEAKTFLLWEDGVSGVPTHPSCLVNIAGSFTHIVH